MVGHSFSRTLPEWPRWLVYFGGVQSHTFCVGKQRSPCCFCLEGAGTISSVWHGGAGNEEDCLLGGLCPGCWSESLALDTHKSKRVGPVAFMVERLLCSSSLLQPVGLVPTLLFSIRGMR